MDVRHLFRIGMMDVMYLEVILPGYDLFVVEMETHPFGLGDCSRRQV
jgi:hypothetical protein